MQPDEFEHPKKSSPTKPLKDKQEIKQRLKLFAAGCLISLSLAFLPYIFPIVRKLHPNYRNIKHHRSSESSSKALNPKLEAKFEEILLRIDELSEEEALAVSKKLNEYLRYNLNLGRPGEAQLRKMSLEFLENNSSSRKKVDFKRNLQMFFENWREAIKQSYEQETKGPYNATEDNANRLLDFIQRSIVEVNGSANSSTVNKSKHNSISKTIVILVIFALIPMQVFAKPYLCASYLKRKARDILADEFATGRLSGECGWHCQGFNENKCHSWAAAVNQQMLYVARRAVNEYPFCKNAKVCVYYVHIDNPGSHDFVVLTVTGKTSRVRPEAFTVDGWLCNPQKHILDLDFLGSNTYELPVSVSAYVPREHPYRRYMVKIFNKHNAPRTGVAQCNYGEMYAFDSPPTWINAWETFQDPNYCANHVPAQHECFEGAGSPAVTPTITSTVTHYQPTIPPTPERAPTRPVPSPTFTFTLTHTHTPTATSTSTPTSTVTWTPTYTLTWTHTFTSTSTPTPSHTATVTSTWTSTCTPTQTSTPTETPTATMTQNPTFTLSPTTTPTASIMPSPSPVTPVPTILAAQTVVSSPL